MEEYIIGTKIQEWIWKTRHLYKGVNWARGYCDSTDHPHRQILVGRISSYAPFESILEIGCNTGPNLYLLAIRFPNVKFHGLDINHEAIKKGKEWFERVSLNNVVLSLGRADELGRFSDKSMDVIFTDSTMMYLGPDKIHKVIEGMIRIARRVLVFNEHHTGLHCEKGKEYFYFDGHWVYDYEAVLRKHVSSKDIKISKLPEGAWDDVGWKRFGAIIEVKL
jgi:ubiquinone/menaquinone biosynthesis C-methylase UbiE